MEAKKDKVSYVPATMRLAVDDDHNFIYHSWLKSYRASWSRGHNPVRYVHKDIYYQNHKHIIADILRESITVVAVNPEDAGQIFGYIVCQPTREGVGVLHYCFVKQAYRGLGVGTMLYNEARTVTHHDTELPMACSHATGVFYAELGKRYNIIFNPYLIMRSEGEDRVYEN